MSSSVIQLYAQGTQVPRNKGTIAGATYGYLEYLPPDYNVDPNKKFPIIVFLHGVGEKGNGTTDLNKLTAGGPPRIIKDNQWPVKSPKTGAFPAENFIVISPQSPTGYHNNNVLNNFLKFLKTYYRADPDRLYLCGLSAGGISTWFYLSEFNAEVAASILVCGNGNPGNNNCNFKNIPIWAFHGDKDTTVDPYGSINGVKNYNKCAPTPNPAGKVTIYPGVTHDSWTRTFNLAGMSQTVDPKYQPFDISIYDWLLQFKRGAAPSVLPTANAGLDINLTLPLSSTNITGTATPGTGTIASTVWTQVSGPTSATMANGTTTTVSLSGMVAGVYTFRLTVTNSTAQVATDDVKVTVVSANLPPVANAGPDLPITLPTNSLTINGTGTDIDGTIASYAWTKVSGPAFSQSGQATANFSVSALVQGTYVFSLKVTDDDGATASDNVTVTVNPAAVNQAPTASAGIDKSVNLPTSSVNLTGSGTDLDGTIASYLWEKVSGPTVSLANATTSTLTANSLLAGVYVFRLTVTDDKGLTASDEATITVVAANQSPTASAGTDITITLPTNATPVPGSGNDNDGTVAIYAWTQVGGPNTATITNIATPTLATAGLIAGTYTFRLTVTDDDGATGFDDVKVIVNAAPVNAPPTANAGTDKGITLPTNMFTFNGAGNDPESGPITFTWIKVSGPPAGLTNQNTANLTATTLTAGTYVFRLTVTDNQGATGTDDVTLVVQPAVVNQAPIASAGVDLSITLPTNSITVTGSATDNDGTIASYLWTKISGPAATATGTTTTTLQLAGMVAGTYVYQLTATDDKGATASDNVSIVVNAANVPPTASAGLDITINLPTNSTVINGSGDDMDGTVTLYAWTQVSGPTTATLGNSNTSSVTASSMVAGTYTFRLTVADNNSATGFDDVKVIVNAANQTPTAGAGTDKMITLPANTINITGTGTDNDGTIASYAWTQISGPGAATLTNPSTPTVSIAVTSDGTFVFRLTVVDNGGASDFDDVTLTVNPATINQPPTANAGLNQGITLPLNSLTLTGNGSDPDGTIASYLWTKFSGPIATLTNTTNPVLSISDLINGTYTFRLTVTDNEGLTAFDDVTVTVSPAAVNQPPAATAPTDKILTLPANSITLLGTASDNDGTVVEYLWSQVSGPAGAALTNQTTPNLSLASLVQGIYTFRFKVTDNDGATAFDDVIVTVNSAAVNQAPVADAGADKNISLPTSAGTLDGSGSDNDGTVVSYLWVKVSGPAGSTGALNQASLALSGLVEGTYVFRLEVTDDDGATDTDDVTLTVLPAATNQPPVVSTGTDKNIFLPDNFIDLIGTATDADGSITGVLWTKISGGTATLVNETTTVLSVEDLVQGSYVFRLTATDDDGATSFDEVTVVVNAATVNQPPVANAGDDVSIKLPLNTATLSGSGTDADGTISSFFWSKVSGPAVNVNGTGTATLSLSALVEGSYVFELTVTDDDGATHADQVKVTVLSAAFNVPPVVDAGLDVEMALPDNTTTLVAVATDDGTISSYTWTQLSGPAATFSGANTDALLLTNLIVGTYSFKVEVQDDGGLTAFDDVAVTVNSGEPNETPDPVVDAGADQTIQLPVDTLQIAAVSEFPGLISSYEWQQTSGNPLAFETSDNILKLSNLSPGTYTFRITVRDDLGNEASDDVIVEVKGSVPYNVFSPNNDGQVDTWTIPDTDEIADCDITVYNRQGQKVFQSKGYSTPWDGTLNGKQVPEGVYIYFIRCPGQKVKNGSVTIIR